MTTEPSAEEGTGSPDPGSDPLPASWQAARDLPRLALVESSSQLPGLLPAAAWRVLDEADVVVAVDPDDHPCTAPLADVDVEVGRLEAASSGPQVGRNLLERPPTGQDALARGALDLARDHDLVALLLPPDDTELAHDIGVTAGVSADVQVEWVFLVGAPLGLELLRLVAVMDRLLDPDDGCPWDLEQTHESLAPHLVEETYEAVDAIAAGDDDHVAEELGDVLMQVVFHARLARGRGAFDVDTVAAGIADKLVRRHPHVFGDVEVADADEVKDNWDTIKAAEKPDRESPFDGIARSLPSLPLAGRVATRAGRLGWNPDVVAAGDQLVAAATEAAVLLEESADAGPATDEPDADAVVDEALGRVGMALVALARAADRDADLGLRRAVARFIEVFETAAAVDAADDEGGGGGEVARTTAQWQALLDEAATHGD